MKPYRATKINHVYGQIELWQSVATDRGTLTVPKEGGGTVSTGDYSFILDSYAAGVDALCVKLVGGKPIDEVATTTAGIPITVTSIAANGDYVLSAVPPADIGIIFKIKIKLINWDLVDEDYIVDRYQINSIPSIQIANGSLGTAETTGNKAFIDPIYNFTAEYWELTGEIDAGGNASLKIDVQEAGVSLVGVGHTYPQMTAVAVGASPAKASVTGSCADWTTKIFDMSKHYDFLVDSVTDTERWRLTIYGYKT